MDGEILVIDADEGTATALKGLFEGTRIISKQRLSSGLKAIREHQVILLGETLQGRSGLEALREINSYSLEAVVVRLGPEGIDALKEGAYACIEKPFKTEFLRLTIERALRYAGMKEELIRLKTVSPPPVITHSHEMLKVMRQVILLSPKNTPVLISGEPGTGRGLIARAIHYLGPRKARPFLIVSAGDFSEGSKTIQEGLKEKGTLFIKDMDGLEPALQERLLGLLHEEGLILPEAGKRVNVRVIGACIAPPPGLADPWAVIKVPPLRKRKEDILPLARHFLGEAEIAFDDGPKKLSREAERFLMDYPWHGNVRELKNTIRKAYIVSKDPVIRKDVLLFDGKGSIKEFLEYKLKKYMKEIAGVNSNLHDTVISEAEKALIEIALEKTGGNQLRAAKLLDISRNTLRAKVKKYRIMPAKT